ncbi:alpha/beta hydrolase family protein [Streptomyces prasinus]
MNDDFERTRRYRYEAPDGRAALVLTSPVHPSASDRRPGLAHWRDLTVDPALAGLEPGRPYPRQAEIETAADPDGDRRPALPARLLPVAPAWHPRLPLLAGLALDERTSSAYLWTADHDAGTVRTYLQVAAATGLTALGPSGSTPLTWLGDGRIALLTAADVPRTPPSEEAHEWRPIAFEATGPAFVSFEPGEEALLSLAGTVVTVVDTADGTVHALTPPLLVRQLAGTEEGGLFLEHAHPAAGTPDRHGLRWTRSCVHRDGGRLVPAPATAGEEGRTAPHGPRSAGEGRPDGDLVPGNMTRHDIDTGFGQGRLTVVPRGDGSWLLWIRALREGEQPSPGIPAFLAGACHGVAILDLPLYWPDDAVPKLIHHQVTGAVARAVALLTEARRGAVVVGGHSFGATLALYALAHLETLAGAIAHSGCYNRTLTPTGFHYERRTLWAATDMYREFSALEFATRLTRPVLLVHGAEDRNTATPSDQAVELYRAVVATGGQARLVLLPDEGHTFRSREAMRTIVEEHHDWLERC